MEINFEEFNKWIAALDSGEYKQGQNQLHTLDNKFCCLGVGIKVLVPLEKLNISNCGKILGGFPSSQNSSPDWLKQINDDFEIKTGCALSSLNDNHNFTFPEIATMLELVYVHKILDDDGC